MSRLAVIALALLVLAMPASAEKVAYLLEETGRVDVDLFVDLPEDPDYHETFQYDGPFYPALPFTQWRSPSFGADDNTWVRAYIELQSSGYQYFATFADWHPNGESQLPNSASVTWILDWSFIVGNEPMQASLAGGMNDYLTDEDSGTIWAAGTPSNRTIVDLTPGTRYGWHMDLATTQSHDFLVTAGIAFPEGQLLPLPEPGSLWLLGTVILWLLCARLTLIKRAAIAGGAAFHNTTGLKGEGHV